MYSSIMFNLLSHDKKWVGEFFKRKPSETAREDLLNIPSFTSQFTISKKNVKKKGYFHGNISE